MVYRYVDASEMRVIESFYISESFYEPKVDIGPIKGCLNGFQQKSEVCYAVRIGT